MATMEELVIEAKREGSERGRMGKWPRARLAQVPNAGDLVSVDGNWYVAVAGVRREGYGGSLGGLYARWVMVPDSECQDW